MAARTPRRSFATPFVITLAAIPACVAASAPPAQEPPPQQPAPAPAPPPAPPPVVVANPPRPTPPPADAPPSTAPNPPPPQQDGAWTVFKSKDGCMAAIKVECPKGKPGGPMPTCNPPPPMKYACPDGVTLDKPITVITFGDSCAIQPEPMQCPPNAICNPPRPRQVPCPTR